MVSFTADVFFMQEAIKEAEIAYKKGDVPVGAIIEKDGQIISRAHNETKNNVNAILHAEILAVFRACKYLKNERILGTTMYTTLEPCAMCAGALVHARIKNLVIAAMDEKTGACGSVLNIVNAPELNHKVNLVTGVMGEESTRLLKKFFKELRESSKLR